MRRPAAASQKDAYYTTAVAAVRGKITELKEGVKDASQTYTGPDDSGRATGSATGL